MHGRNHRKKALEVDAFIHGVDVVSREFTAVVNGALVRFYVPPGCDIVLRGERIKLRMVQPGDRVRVMYSQLADAIVACRLEVQPAYPSVALSP